MKISKYTFIFDVDNTSYYIYSTLSNALLEVDEDSYTLLLKAQKNNLNIISTELDDELYQILVLKKFIVENDIDSFLYYKSIITAQRNSQSFIHLTVAPTMDCCFRCYYCFEEYKEKNYMTEDVMDSIIKQKLLIKFANTLASHRTGILAWYDHCISTGKVEGINNKIKTMKRQAYGYRDSGFFNLKILAMHDKKYAFVG